MRKCEAKNKKSLKSRDFFFSILKYCWYNKSKHLLEHLLLVILMKYIISNIQKTFLNILIMKS